MSVVVFGVWSVLGLVVSVFGLVVSVFGLVVGIYTWASCEYFWASCERMMHQFETRYLSKRHPLHWRYPLGGTSQALTTSPKALTV